MLNTPEVYSADVFQVSPAASDGSTSELKVPVRLPQSKRLNELPAAGVKPLIRSMSSVPPKARPGRQYLIVLRCQPSCRPAP